MNRDFKAIVRYMYLHLSSLSSKSHRHSEETGTGPAGYPAAGGSARSQRKGAEGFRGHAWREQAAVLLPIKGARGGARLRILKTL